MKPIQNAIIGGTGIYEISLPAKSVFIKTEYGNVNLELSKFKKNSVVFLARHGKKHATPPHLINYRANLKALKSIGVKYIFSTFAIGSLSEKIPVGSLVILKDFIDMTKKRPETFFDGKSSSVKHVKMDDPYCNNLRKILKDKARKNGLILSRDSVYVCTEGPRFETKAEIKMMKLMGADVVGMTCVPEVILAKELGICYASIGIIVNMATGIGTSLVEDPDLKNVIKTQKKKINTLLLETLSENIEQSNCTCKDSIISL